MEKKRWFHTQHGSSNGIPPLDTTYGNTPNTPLVAGDILAAFLASPAVELSSLFDGVGSDSGGGGGGTEY